MASPAGSVAAPPEISATTTRNTVGGYPLPRAEQRIDGDPRDWPAFGRAVLDDGVVEKDTLIAPKAGSAYKRPPSEFNGKMLAPGLPAGEGEFTAEANRYHLLASGVCPWASGCMAVRALMGLESVVGLDIADGQSSAGWVFLGGLGASGPWSERSGEAVFLHEVYTASEPRCSARITVPVLWDNKTGKVVSNDSWDIMKFFSTSFASLGAVPDAAPPLFPAESACRIDELHAKYKDALLNGVYRAGVGLIRIGPEGHAGPAAEVYACLKELDALLQVQRFSAGANLTLVDVRLAMCLIRFDAAYYDAFDLRGAGHIFHPDPQQMAFPALARFAREIIAMLPKNHVQWLAFPQYFRWTAGHDRSAKLPDLAAIAQLVESPPGTAATVISCPL